MALELRQLFEEGDVVILLGENEFGHCITAIRNYTSPAARGRSSLFKVWWRLRI